MLGPLRRARPVLVPNERGLDRALACGATEIAVFGSATETFSQRNLNRSVAESLEMFRPVVTRALDAKLPVRGYSEHVLRRPVGRSRLTEAGRAARA